MKKIFAVLMALTLVLSMGAMFVGCNNDIHLSNEANKNSCCQL